MKILKILIKGILQRILRKTPVKPPGAAGLTVLCPIINGNSGQQSYAMLTRAYLQDMPLNEHSPMARVPNTYLCRFYVLNDVFYQGAPALEEHLKSKYLVFSTNYYGSLDDYLKTMWTQAEEKIKPIWEYCVGFDKVKTPADFAEYIKKCQVNNHLFFNGSTGDPLEEQLKTLYLKQEFSRFAYENQGRNAADLQKAFQEFITRTQPKNVTGPTWVAGAHEEMVKP